MGGDGRVRVAPRPARALPAPARPGPRRLRGRPAQPGPPEGAPDHGREPDPRDNVLLLEHEQRALVQPNLEGLSCAFARLFSIGSALSFEVRGLNDEVSYFTSFYYYALTEGIREALHVRAWPRITRLKTAGAGSSPASSPASAGSTSRRPWSMPACAASSTRRATTRRTPASSLARLCRLESEGLTREAKPE